MVKLTSIRAKYKELFGSSIEVDALICHTLGIDKSKLFQNINITQEDANNLEENLKRLEKGEPLAYITEHREFMSLDFSVNPSTLIPRHDTEILVEEIIKFYNDKSPLVFEIGTGSGCIAISLAKHLKDSKIIACDISDKALETASFNALKNEVSDRITFINQDILKGFPPLPDNLDCIVSNPPYIEKSVIATLDDSIKNFEPVSALDGGDDGLIFYRKIIKDNPLKKGGLLAFEIGYNQGEAVSSLMENDFSHIKIIKDLGKNDRVVMGIKK